MTPNKIEHFDGERAQQNLGDKSRKPCQQEFCSARMPFTTQ
jgi:hypothetical protein